MGRQTPLELILIVENWFVQLFFISGASLIKSAARCLCCTLGVWDNSRESYKGQGGQRLPQHPTTIPGPTAQHSLEMLPAIALPSCCTEPAFGEVILPSWTCLHLCEGINGFMPLLKATSAAAVPGFRARIPHFAPSHPSLGTCPTIPA